MPELLLGSILIKVGASFATSALKAGYKHLTDSPAFAKAAAETQKEFSELVLEPSLRKWCEGAEFNKTLSLIEKGLQISSDEVLVDTFIQEGGFYAAEDTKPLAEKVLLSFLHNLEAEVIRSPDGLVAVARQQPILHEKTRDSFQETVRPVLEELGDIKSTVRSVESSLASLSDKSFTQEQVEEKVYHARIDEARQILEAGKPKTAKQRLEVLRGELAKKNPSRSLLYRIAANLGSCAIHLDEQEVAIREIEFAYSLEPENPQAISNASTGALLQGRPELALELAVKTRKITAQDSVATANYIRALFALGRGSELERFLESEPWIQNDKNCCFTIGYNLFESGRYAESEKFLRTAFKIAPEEPRILVLLAHSLIRPVQLNLAGRPVFRWRFPADYLVRLNEASGLLTEAISRQQALEDRRFLAIAHVLRADARRMTGDPVGAIADCDAALTSEEDDGPRQIKALSLVELGRLSDAILCFKQIADPGARERMMFPLAAAYIAADKAAEAVELINPYWQKEEKGGKEILTAALLLAAYGQLEDTKASDNLIAIMRSKWPGNSDALSAIARHYQREGKLKEAIGLFSEALDYSTTTNRDFTALELADAYYEDNQFGKASDFYGLVANLDANNYVTQRYVVCLYNSGALREALNIAKRIRKDGEPLLVISHIEARVLMAIGDLPSAQALLERLLELNPTAYSYRIEAVDCARRMGQLEKAKNLLSALTFDVVKKDAVLLMRVAHLRALLKMADVLKYAYEARRAGFSNPQIHLAYVHLFSSREQVNSIELSKDIVDLDCSIILEAQEGKLVYTILRGSDLNIERGEISRELAQAMDIIGRKKGDRFVLRKTQWKNLECTVLEVQSKYVRAFQETLEKFPALFPTNTLLQPIHGTYEDMRDGILRQLDEEQTVVRKIISFYEAKMITVESMAQFFGKSLVETWASLTGGHYCKFLACSGNLDEINRDLEQIQHVDSLVLELLSVLALAQLGLLQSLSKRFKTLITTQPVVDCITDSLANNMFSSPGGLTLGKRGADYVKQEITADILASNRHFLETIQSFLLSNVTIVPVTSSLEDSGASLFQSKDKLGPISVSCLLAAREKKAVLLSDDEMLRALGRNETGVTGVWTQTLLQELLRNKVLTESEYTEAVAKLVLLNYKFVSFGAEVVMWILSKSNSKITPEVILFLDVFRGPECTLESAVGVLSDVLKRFWLENALYETKLDLLDKILDVITLGRPLKYAIEAFALIIKLRFLLLPTAEKAIVRHIALWQNRQMNRVGLIQVVSDHL